MIFMKLSQSKQQFDSKSFYINFNIAEQQEIFEMQYVATTVMYISLFWMEEKFAQYLFNT